jgi:MFS family permease
MARKDTKLQPEYYGWVVVFIAFVLNVLSFGGLALVAVLIKPLAHDFGWQRGEIAAAFSIAGISTAVCGVAFGRISDLYGARVISALGALTVVTCLFLLARITALWQLYLLYALFGALGHAATTIPLMAAITNWFKINRGLAVSMALTGAPIGIGALPFIAGTLIADAGWRDALLYLGLAYFVIAVPLVLLVRDPPKAKVDEVSNPVGSAQAETGSVSPREALVWICTAVIFCCVCMAVPQIHVPALASDAGLSPSLGASVLTVAMFSGAIGRLTLGHIADRIGSLNTYIIASLGQTVFVFWFTQMSSLTSFYLIAIGYGLFSGGVITSAYLTIRSLVPSRIAGTALAIVGMFGWIGMGLGSYMGGHFFDAAGTYKVSFAVAAAAGTINLAILLSFTLRLRQASRLKLDAQPARAA